MEVFATTLKKDTNAFVHQDTVEKTVNSLVQAVKTILVFMEVLALKKDLGFFVSALLEQLEKYVNKIFQYINNWTN